MPSWFAAICVIALWTSATAQLVSLEAYPYAKCLDGSPSGYYFREASSDRARRKWLVVLEGGGICTGQADCTARAETDLGSSKNWDATFDWNSTSLTTTDTRNPFSEWNVAWVKYCDGSMFTGSRKNTSADTFFLWFSGHNTIAAVVDSLVSKSGSNGLNSTAGGPSFFALSGGSAGALGAFANVDFVASRLTSNVSVVGIPVGGYVPNIRWFQGHVHNTPSEDVRDDAFAHHTKLFQSYLPQACVEKLGPSQSYKCIVPRLTYPFYTRPLFIIEALTDACILCGFEGIGKSPESCWVPVIGGGLLRTKEEKAWMSQYGQNASANMRQVIENPRDGLFAPSCFLHCHFTLDHPKLNNSNAVDAAHQWLIQYLPQTMLADASGERQKSGNQQFTWIDRCPNNQYWPPCNPTCPFMPTTPASKDLRRDPFNPEL